MNRTLIFLSVTLLIILLITSYVIFDTNRTESSNEFFFGVSCGSSTTQGAKDLIDKVKNFTNFIIINNWAITTNQTALNEICQYATAANLSFIVFFDYIIFGSWHENWIETAKHQWNDKFLGIYIYEEPGGKQIDTGLFDEFKHGERGRMYENVTTYSEAADVFVNELPKGLSFNYLQNKDVDRFVSDYALYWYDYLAGYTTVFVELGWNHSTTQQIALGRGAATNQGKDWGAIITWTYQNPPYLADGAKILEDMISAYDSGAKYIVIFNFPQYPENNRYGILNDEHFEAMQRFWSYTQKYPENQGKTPGEVAFVLPKDYGWGMRYPEDKIWGLWQADNRSTIIWKNMNQLLEVYNTKLDIVYDDSRFIYNNYSKVYLWNNTIT